MASQPARRRQRIELLASRPYGPRTPPETDPGHLPRAVGWHRIGESIMAPRSDNAPIVQISFHWEPERKGWLARATYRGIGVIWRRIDHTGAPTIEDTRMLFERCVSEVETWLF